MAGPKKWRLLDSRVVYDAPRWLRLRKDRCRLPGGLEIDDYFVLEVPDYCMLVPVLDDGRLVMTREYKHAVGRVTLQLPAGLVDSRDRSPRQAALRELEEETGYRPGRLEKLGSFYTVPGRLANRMHLFLATSLRFTGRRHWDQTEQIETVLAPPARCLEWIRRGGIKDQASTLGILLAADRLARRGPR